MMTNFKDDGQWSGKKMEGSESLKTLECLRGRLLAERQSSRSAKEEAEFMGKKLIDLENQIRKEITMRKKAEKKLKLLMKKLESLNIITSLSIASQNSTSSEISTNSSSIAKDTEEREFKSENLVSTIPENQGEKVPEITNLSIEVKNHQNVLDRANSSPNSSTDPHQISQSFSEEANKKEKKNHYEETSVESVAGTLSTGNENARAMKLKIKPGNGHGHERVTEILDAMKIKNIGENNQSSFQRRYRMEVIMSM